MVVWNLFLDTDIKKTQVNTTIDHVKNRDDQNRKGRNTTSDGPTLLIKGLIKENKFKRRREVLVFTAPSPYAT